MKALFALLSFLFAFANLSAQGINWIYGTSNYTDGSNILAISPNEWVVSGKSSEGGGFLQTRPFLGSYSGDEWMDFNITDLIDYYGELAHISHLTYDPSIQQFYFVLGQDVCDVTLPNLLFSTGQAGTWTKQIVGSFTESFPVCAVPENGVIWGRKNGTSLTWQRTPEDDTDLASVLTGEDLYDLQFWRTGNFVLQTETNLYACTFDDSGATIDNTYASTSSILAFSVLNENQLVVVEADKITLLDNELDVIMSINPEGSSTPHITKDANGIYLIRDMAENGQQIFFMDHNLMETGRTDLGIASYEIGNIAAQDGRIAVTGAHQFAPLVWSFEPTNSQLFLRTYTASGPDLNPQHDLALESITYDDARFYTPDGWWCNNAEFDNMLVTVRNNGDTPIKDVLLKFDTDICHGICDGYLTRTQLHEDINLAPGQSITLPFENFILNGLMQADELDMCINVTAPDHPMETTLDNNSICETIMVVDTEAPPVEEELLRVYPNPVAQVLHIEIPPQAQSIQIYDAIGKLVLQENTTALQGRYELDVQVLEKGIYFIRALGGQVIHTASFIRQ